jgi:hypothetical protein
MIFQKSELSDILDSHFHVYEGVYGVRCEGVCVVRCEGVCVVRVCVLY